MEKNLPACPVETTLMLISDRWKVLIIRDLLDGTKRFGEIKKSVGNISQKVLTANLRSMEDRGLLTRKVYPEVPPRVEYTLTETGYSLKPVLDAMGDRIQTKKRPKSTPILKMKTFLFSGLIRHGIKVKLLLLSDSYNRNHPGGSVNRSLRDTLY